MSQATISSKVVLSLYKDFLRFALKMKYDDARPGRNLREKLIEAIKENFRTNKNEAEIAKIKELTQYGQTQLETLQKLTSNELRNKYPIRSIPVPEYVAKNAKEILSTKHQQTYHRKPGWFTRFIKKSMGWNK